MITSRRITAALSAGVLVSLLGVAFQAAGQALVYQPPQRGAASGEARVGGGTRGAEDRSFTLSVLAPNHAGLTAREQPTLYWFASEQISVPVEVTLLKEDVDEPVLDLKLSPPLAAGIQRISLAEHGVRLVPGVPYQWYVALVIDPAQRSKDIIAGGEVELVTPSADVAARLAAAAQPPTYLYASEGYWYDALEEISGQVSAAPADRELKEARASLLEQVGLAEAAGYERAR